MRVLVCFILLLFAAFPAAAETYVQMEMYDRPRLDCDGVDLALAKAEHWDCRYTFRATLNLEFQLFDGMQWLRGLARTDVTSRTSVLDSGHFTPVKADLGGGLVAGWGNWTATILASSRHCMDFGGCRNDAYNTLIVRWSKP